MTGEPLLRIGPFARASWLSIKALRAYHEIGLLIPAEIDPVTGYRLYAASQLNEAAVIRRLRRLDVPLQAIQQVLQARDPQVTKKVLGEHRIAVQARLAEIERTLAELDAAFDWPAIHTPVHLRREAAQTVLQVAARVTEAQFAPFLDRTRDLLTGAAADLGAVVTGPFGGCYPPMDQDDAQDVVAFLPIAPETGPAEGWRSADIAGAELPAADVAVLTHHGGYETLEDSYLTLGSWVAHHDNAAELPVREFYLVCSGDSDQFRTEICWPVKGRECAGDSPES